MSDTLRELIDRWMDETHTSLASAVSELLAANWPQQFTQDELEIFVAALDASGHNVDISCDPNCHACKLALKVNALLRPGEQQKAAQPGESGKEPGK